jgi:hypothetical protein
MYLGGEAPHSCVTAYYSRSTTFTFENISDSQGLFYFQTEKLFLGYLFTNYEKRSGQDLYRMMEECMTKMLINTCK